jgi:hypothetical protein
MALYGALILSVSDTFNILLLAMYFLVRFLLGSYNLSEHQMFWVSAIICLVTGVWLSPKIKHTIYKWTGIDKIGLGISWLFVQISDMPLLEIVPQLA